MSDDAFTPLPPVPDHPALEHEVLAWWDEERVFDRLREQNRGNPRWSSVDGPITANNPMGVHHAWGRASAPRRCAASTSATRTASTARASGPRSRSRRSSA